MYIRTHSVLVLGLVATDYSTRYTHTHQHASARCHRDEEVCAHKQHSPPDVPHSVPQVTPTALQAVGDGIRCLDGFLQGGVKEESRMEI